MMMTLMMKMTIMMMVFTIDLATIDGEPMRRDDSVDV